MSCGFLTTPIFAVEQMKRDDTAGNEKEDAPLYPLARVRTGFAFRDPGLGRVVIGRLLLKTHGGKADRVLCTMTRSTLYDEGHAPHSSLPY